MARFASLFLAALCGIALFAAIPNDERTPTPFRGYGIPKLRHAFGVPIATASRSSPRWQAAIDPIPVATYDSAPNPLSDIASDRATDVTISNGMAFVSAKDGSFSAVDLARGREILRAKLDGVGRRIKKPACAFSESYARRL